MSLQTAGTPLIGDTCLQKKITFYLATTLNEHKGPQKSDFNSIWNHSHRIFSFINYDILAVSDVL